MSDLITPLDEIELEVVRIGAEVRAAKLFQRLIATIDQYRARLRQERLLDAGLFEESLKAMNARVVREEKASEEKPRGVASDRADFKD